MRPVVKSNPTFCSSKMSFSGIIPKGIYFKIYLSPRKKPQTCSAWTSKHGSKCSIRLVHSVHSLPYREGVQIFPFITLPQKIAPILPVGEQQRFCCVSGEVVMVPPGETQGVKASFTPLLTGCCCSLEQG